MAITNNLLAFYKLDNTNDSSGNNRTLTNNGNVSFASGKIGNAASFDGSNQLQVTNPIAEGAEYSIAGWVKFSNFDSLQYVLSFGNDMGVLYHNGVSPAEVIFTPSVGSYIGVGTPSAGDWHFIYASRKANGDYAISIDNGALVTGNAGETYYGTFEIGNLLNGSMDAVGIWSRSLTESEITELYNSGTGLEIEAPVVDLASGLQAFYKLSDLSDSSGNNKTLTNNGNVSFASGKLGNAAVFDGSGNGYLSIENYQWAEFGSNSFALQAWINPASVSMGKSVISKGNDGDLGDNVWTLEFNSSENLEFFGAPGLGSVISSNFAFSQNTWYHIMLVRDSDTYKFYVNGTLTSTVTNNSPIEQGGHLLVGSGWYDPSSSYRSYEGQIDAVGIWNRALSDSEVAALYNSGTGLELPEAPAVKNGWITDTYWINDVATSLDENGDGTWVGKLYENGSLFSGSKYSLTFVAGVAQAENIVTVIGASIPVAFGLNEAEEPLVELVFASITSAGETVIEQIIPTVLPTGYTVAETVLAYSIDTTATFEGTINVDFILPSNISQAVFDRVKGFHVKNNGSIEEMTRVSSDFSTKRITVAITSFSDFLFLDEPQVNKSAKVIGKSKFVGKVKFA